MARPNTEAEAARRWGDDGRSRYAGGFVSVRTLWIGGFSGLPAGGGEWACGEMNSPKYRGLTVGKSAPSCATRGAERWTASCRARLHRNRAARAPMCTEPRIYLSHRNRRSRTSDPNHPSRPAEDQRDATPRSTDRQGRIRPSLRERSYRPRSYARQRPRVGILT